MSDFADLRLDARLLERLHELGLRRPTALQLDAVPVIGRGTTAFGVASAGCGKTLALGLGLAARLDPAGPPAQALILRPTDDGAASAADALHELLAPVGLSVSLVQPSLGTATHIGVASPTAALAALEHSAIKLDDLHTLIVDGASAMLQLDAAALETLTAQVPRDAQRVVLTSELTHEVDGWLERHARRARRLAYLPPEPEALGSDVALEFWCGPRQEWLSVIVQLFATRPLRGGTRITVYCRSLPQARELAQRLAVRGTRLAQGTHDEGVRVETEPPEPPEPAALSVSWGAPADVATLRARLAGASRAVVFAEPRELPHLQRILPLLGLKASPLRSSPPPEAAHSARATRELLRDAARSRDLEPYMLLLEPLLEEFTPSQLAAAAAALLRERLPDAPPQPLPAWTRLYFGVGRRDGVRPADLVGAITGETRVTGEQVGRIEIRDTHCSVEVAASVADQVIKGLATTTIRGRPANVRVFRE
jgi:ATP-dependent RNA helicase DeaD